MLDGEVKLYEYEGNYTEIDMNSGQASKHSSSYFYIEKDEDIVLINYLLHKKKLAELFNDNQILVSKILNEEYVIDNIYLIVKYYNENK